jgi:transcription initiation factor TFIIB
MQCINIVFDPERGTIICADTGEIIEEMNIDVGPEWRAYTPEEYMERARTSTITQRVHDAGLATDIDTSINSYKSKRLAILQRKIRVEGKTSKKIVDALSQLNHMAALLNLPSQAIETAATILKKIFATLQPRSDKLKILALTSIVLAARKHNIPIRVKELITRFDISEEEYWKFMSEVYFKVNLGELKAYVDPRKFLPSIVNNLGVSQKVFAIAAKIIDVLKREGLTEGKDPAGIAAASIYIASILADEKRTQKQVAEAANVTEVTIRNRYRDIVNKLTITVYL